MRAAVRNLYARSRTASHTAAVQTMMTNTSVGNDTTSRLVWIDSIRDGTLKIDHDLEPIHPDEVDTADGENEQDQLAPFRRGTFQNSGNAAAAVNACRGDEYRDHQDVPGSGCPERDVGARPGVVHRRDRQPDNGRARNRRAFFAAGRSSFAPVPTARLHHVGRIDPANQTSPASPARRRASR